MPDSASPTAPGQALDVAALLRLQAWFSPAFPIGAFSYSHGLEHAVEAGLVRDAEGARRWVTTVIEDGTGIVDAMLFAAAWRATAGEPETLAGMAELAAALPGTSELARESALQGTAFLDTVEAAWPSAALAAARGAILGDVALPVAAAIVVAAHGIPLRPALVAYLHALAANMVSAAVRLVPLGQTDGQRITAALEPVIAATAREVLDRPLDEIGAATPMLDWCSMQHETQHVRLFRS
jgi:urease accessory protein